VHSQLLPFVGAAILIALTPGADTALVVRNALIAGAAPARRTALGTASGLMVWGAASACGVAAVLNASAEAYTTVKLAGAAYLAYLGVRSIRDSMRPHAAPVAPRRAATPFFQGLLNNVLNPKVAVFYLTFLPQFIDPTGNVLAQSLLFALAHAAMGIAWLAAYAYVLVRLSAFFARRGVRAWLERVTGTVLVALGLRLAFERR
jgi:threonine/homoserine/homoserine lactone efflux protein